MPALVRHLLRIGRTVSAIILVLVAMSGVHLHAEHDGHDHHHADAGLHHDHDDGEGDLILHAHDALHAACAPDAPHASLTGSLASAAPYRHGRDPVPDHRARDIDPPPNKRVL